MVFPQTWVWTLRGTQVLCKGEDLAKVGLNYMHACAAALTESNQIGLLKNGSDLTLCWNLFFGQNLFIYYVKFSSNRQIGLQLDAFVAFMTVENSHEKLYKHHPSLTCIFTSFVSTIIPSVEFVRDSSITVLVRQAHRYSAASLCVMIIVSQEVDIQEVCKHQCERRILS